MSRKSKEQQKRNRDQRGLNEPPGEPAEQPLWERRMEERAVRCGWLIDGEVKSKIISRLVRTISRDDVWLTEEGEPITNDREVNAAAKTLVYADLGQQRIDLQLKAIAERRYAAARAAEGALGGSSETEPTDPEKYDWYGAGCPCGLPAGECRDHPRARESQKPPPGDWAVWAYIAGRGSGKTRAGAEWVQSRVDAGEMRIGLIIAPTAADIRDVMVEGPSGILAVAPPHSRPVFEPSKRRLTWPNGARAICLSGEEPERARGHNGDTIWADELACWARPQATWDNLMLANRAGTPKALITTTPRRVATLKTILAQESTVKTTDSTYANAAQLPPTFLNTITAMYGNTRLGRQELYAEMLDTSEGVWFSRFDPKRHITADAEYHPGWPVRIAVDAGTSRHTGAVFFQARTDGDGWPKITVFGEYHGHDIVSAKNASAIKATAGELPCGNRIDLVRLDPAATAKSSLGPAAYGEYERVFGSRILERWPFHLVLDGLDTIELLLDLDRLIIHPRCVKLKEAFGNYCHKKRGTEWIDFPADSHPEEDMMDALRGGVRDALPDGIEKPKALRTVHAGRVH